MKKFLLSLLVMVMCFGAPSSAQAPTVKISNLGNDYFATSYGVKCDGVTDDTTAIQRTITAALGSGRSGRVILPAGTCLTGPLTFGPVADPFQVGTDDSLSHTGVGLSFTAPRAATVTFVASPSSNISFANGVITSADIGNYIFYGTADADYTAIGETRVLRPTYGCTIATVTSATTGTCTATTYKWQVGSALTTAAGAQSVYITDDHSFTIDDTVFNATTGATLTAEHVGKTIEFVLPVVRSPRDFDDALRPGDHSGVDPSPSPCTSHPETTDDWQCLQDANAKSKYFSAVITAVTDSTHGKFQITGLQNGSNWVALFPDYPTHAAQGGVCGGPEVNCAANASHNWAHNLPGTSQLIGMNPHIDHYLTPELQSDLNEFQNKHTYLGTIRPYALPADTAQQYVSFKGASMATTVLSFTGCPNTGQWDDYCAAVLFSKNKYFTWEDMSLTNASGSDRDDLTQWGAYFGGLPGIGAQALVFNVNRVEISGFGVCWQFGDDNGAAASDFDMTTVAATSCGVGMRVTGQNTLDINITDFLGGFNKIAFLNYAGNIHIRKVGVSYNLIDFASAGFGPFTIENVRTEGPGIPIIGGEPGFSVTGMNVAEPQASRQLSGTVTATPNDTHTVAGVAINNDDTGTPAGSFYPITFGSTDITAEDIRKIVVLPDVGAGTTACVGQIWTVDSATTGTVYVQESNCVQTSSTETVTIYDSATCDLTFPADELTAGDVGGALALPNASVEGAWNRAVRVVVTEVTSTTTGTGAFYLGNQGAGPVTPAGGSDEDPVLFVNMAMLLDSGASSFRFESNTLGTASIVMPLTAAGGFTGTMMNNLVWAPGQWPLTLQLSGKRYALDVDLTDLDLDALPTPTSALSSNLGARMPWTLVDTSNQGFKSQGSIFAQGNLSYLYGGPTAWALNEGTWQFPTNTDEALTRVTTPGITFDSLLNPFMAFLQPVVTGSAPTQQLSRVKLLSESGYANGRNLRVSCTFATDDECAFSFERTESIEVRRGIASPTDFNAVTRTYDMNVTSGHFTQSDVGKTFVLEGCCTGTNGGIDFYGYIVGIESATIINVRALPGGNSFPSGQTLGNAVIGQNEPDGLYMPFLSCDGNVAANETFKVGSLSTTGFVITSSEAASVATCRVLIVR